MFFKSLNQMSEEYYIVLRGPLESKRQSPQSLASILLLSIFLQCIPAVIMYFILIDGWVNTFILTGIIILFTLTGLIIILSFIYGLPYFYRKSEKMQYFISIIVLQYLIIVLLLVGFYFLAEKLLYGYGSSMYDTTETDFLLFLFFVFAIGIIIFVLAFTRFLKLLQRGAFKAVSKRGQLRGDLEKRIPSMTPVFISIGTSLSLGSVAIIKLFNLEDIEIALILSLGITLFYVMMFILPEQIVILYCKQRFRSFNFDERGKIYPIGSGDRQS